MTLVTFAVSHEVLAANPLDTITEWMMAKSGFTRATSIRECDAPEDELASDHLRWFLADCKPDKPPPSEPLPKSP